MNTLKLAAIFMLTSLSALSLPINQEEGTIPGNAQRQAEEALQRLGPTRGAIAISFRALAIQGMQKALSSQSLSLKTLLQDLGARESAAEFQVVMAGDILFDFDRADIRPEAESALSKIAALILASKSQQVLIEGHTDSKGKEEYNRLLSERRAAAIRDWLVAHNVPTAILQAVGYGESKPLAANNKPDGSDDPAGRQKNRRVEIRIKK